ncbi:MAG: nucleotidyltransferase family protein [Chitinophagaceae bacterium]
MIASSAIGAIVLAAGSASRFGTPKQLLTIDGVNLLNRTINLLKAAQIANAVIVLGANFKQIQPTVFLPENYQLVQNEHWEAGMSTSIIAGIKGLKEKSPLVKAFLILVCDQPYLTSHFIESLFAAYYYPEKQIVAAAYGNTIGTPLLISRQFEPDLLQLKGDKGAKSIALANKEVLQTIPFEKGVFDIDYPTDWENFIANK